LNRGVAYMFVLFHPYQTVTIKHFFDCFLTSQLICCLFKGTKQRKSSWNALS